MKSLFPSAWKLKESIKSPMRLKDIQKAILTHPDDKDISFLLAFYHNELIVSNSCDFRTVDALFDWAAAQEPGKIGTYAGIALLRGFAHMKELITSWTTFRDEFDAWLKVAEPERADKIMIGLREYQRV